MSRALSVHRMADEPHLAEQLERAVEGAFPAFFAHDRLWNEVFPEVVATFPDLQLLVAVDGEIAGMLNSVAFAWDGSVEDLPHGEHDVMLRSVREHRAGVTPNTLCGIQAVLLPAFIGSGFVAEFLDATSAALRGFEYVVSAIRPTLKERYPNIDIDEYLAWSSDAGEPFDPWIRVQQRRGATTLAVSRDSLVIEGSVDDWQQWCSMAFPATGDYVIEGGQSLLQIDRESDRGVYSEAHVWMQLPGRPA